MGFGASSSGGARGDSGSGGAFTGASGLGLTTGKTWYGNAAFGTPGGMAKGYATGSNGNYSNYRNLDGSPMGQGIGGTVNRGLSALPRPQPVVQPVAQPIPQPVPQPVTQPLGYSWYDALRSSFPPGNDFGSFNPVNGSTHYKNNQGMPANYNYGSVGGSTHYKGW